MGPCREVYTSNKIYKNNITERPHACDHFPVLVRSSILLHGKVWNPRLDDHVDIIIRDNQRASHSLRHDCSTPRLQGQCTKSDSNYHCFVKTRLYDCVNKENGWFRLCRDLSRMPWGTCSSCSSSGAYSQE